MFCGWISNGKYNGERYTAHGITLHSQLHEDAGGDCYAIKYFSFIFGKILLNRIQSLQIGVKGERI